MARSNKPSATASADDVAAALARNSKPAAQPKPAAPALTDHEEREQKKAEATTPKPAVVDHPTPVAMKKVKEGQPCTCGCGGVTGGGRFLPGHDARLHGRIKRYLEGRLDLATLSVGEAKAVEGHVANGHVPNGSFTPQDEKSPDHAKAKNNDRKRALLHAKIARLRAELDAAEQDLASLGEKADEVITPTEHEEIVEAMVAEGTA